MLCASARPRIAVYATITVAVWGNLLLTASATAQESEARPRVTMEGVIVEPSRPDVDTLCRLKVKLRNTGERVASQLGFTVTIDGKELPVYANQLFYYPLEPGGTTEVPLYNFWTTETSRPAPADGKLTVAVSLEEAVWMDISVDGDEVETWKPLGPVEGLPSRASTTVELRRPDRARAP